ncbi:MAG TPA: hypothetical protein VL098_04235 [Flavipsychrobacter sp.]|nr:hypothetical protein [Flavipsychrobacter sp.]
MKNDNIVKNDNIFNDLTVADFELLIEDLKMKQKGIIIHYIVDAHDVLEYCFPYGISFQKEKKSLDRVGDEQLAYYYLFFQNHPILLDEYRVELDSNHLRASSGKGPYLLEQFLKKYRTLEKKQKEELLEEIQNNSSFLVSAAIYASGPQKFYEKLLKESLLASEDSPRSNLPDGEEIFQLFGDAKPTDESTKWFNTWYDSNFQKFVGLPQSKIFEEMQKTHRDLMAIERVVNANLQIRNFQNIANKHVFLYFSSAEKSNEFFNESKILKEADANFVEAFNKQRDSNEGKPTSILRKQKHAYLLFLSQPDRKEIADNESFFKQWIDNLNKIWEFKQQIDVASHTSQNIQDFKEWRDTNLSYAKELENELVAKQAYGSKIHETYQKGKEIALAYLEQRNYEDLRSYLELQFQEYAATAERPNILERGRSMLLTSFSLQSKFSDILHFLNQEKDLRVLPGNDFIIGSYHILPTLLYYRYSNENISSKIPVRILELIYGISSYIGMSQNGKQTKTIEIINDIKNYLNTRGTHQSDYLHQTKLINLFLLQIAPFDEVSRSKVSKQSVNFINDYYNLFDKMISVPFFKQDIKEWIIQKSDESVFQEIEILYVKAWFERRCELYDASINTCNKGLLLRGHDPRFMHGICLAEYCKFLSSCSFSFDDIQVLNKCSLLCEETINLYELSIKEPHSEIVRHLLSGNLISVTNIRSRIQSIIHIMSFVYQVSFDYTQSLQIMRSCSKRIEEFSDSYDHELLNEPEILRTTSLENICKFLNEAKVNSKDRDMIRKYISGYNQTYAIRKYNLEDTKKIAISDKIFEMLNTTVESVKNSL